MKAFLLIWSVLLLSCHAKAQTNNAYLRPTENWAFRSVVDGEPRMLTLKLHKDLTVAYDTENCTLFKVWNGSLQLQGAVFNEKHGPQPTSTGRDYFKNQQRTNAWQVVQNGVTVAAKALFEGYTFDKGQIELKYRIKIDSLSSCFIYERPEYVLKNGKTGFERKYRTEGLTIGVQVMLHTHAAGHATAADLILNGTWQPTTKTEIIQNWGSYRSETGKVVFSAADTSPAITLFFDPRIVQ